MRCWGWRRYKLILDFWGFQLCDSMGQITRSKNCRSRFFNLNTAHNHNFMRISRVLTCLNECGFHGHTRSLLQALYQEIYVTGALGCCRDSFAQFWAPIGNFTAAELCAQFPQAFAT
jgi:hypothetical protein